MDYKAVGARIKQLRIRQGINQTELARAIGVSQTHMSNIENGNSGISLGTAVKISRKLGCSIDSFADEEKYDSKQKKADDGINIDDLIAALRLIRLGE